MRQLPQIKNFLRTPEERFQNLPDFPYQAHYTDIGGLRIAYIDEGPKDGPVVLLMHGEPACRPKKHSAKFTFLIHLEI